MKKVIRNLIYITLIVSVSKTTALAQSTKQARYYAQSTAEQLMQIINPLTGEQATSQVLVLNYNKHTGEYNIQMIATWIGKTKIFKEITVFEVRGCLNVDSHGRTKFEQKCANQAMKTALSNAPWQLNGTISHVNNTLATLENHLNKY